MKKKTLLCMIAILCVITCALSVMLTACGTDSNNSNGFENGGNNNNGSENGDQIVDFNALTENDWKGEKLTEEQWKKAFDSSNFENVTVYIGAYDDTLKSYYNVGAHYLELNSKKVRVCNEVEAIYGKAHEYRIFVENNKVYTFTLVLDERKTTDKNHVEFLWGKGEMDGMTPEDIDKYDENVSFSEYKEKFSEFEYKDGVYFSNSTQSDDMEGNVKISFKGGKLFMLSVDESLIYAYRNYGKTTVSLPIVFITAEDVPNVNDCEHVDANNNDFCDTCWQPTCKEHVDDDKNGYCDWCHDDMDEE